MESSQNMTDREDASVSDITARLNRTTFKSKDERIARRKARAMKLMASPPTKEALEKALKLNRQYRAVVDNHLSTIDNMLEANLEKMVCFVFM